MTDVTYRVGDLYTLMGAAMVKGTTQAALYQWVKRHQVPTVRVGGMLLVRLEDLAGMKVRGQQRQSQDEEHDA